MIARDHCGVGRARGPHLVGQLLGGHGDVIVNQDGGGWGDGGGDVGCGDW